MHATVSSSDNSPDEMPGTAEVLTEEEAAATILKPSPRAEQPGAEPHEGTADCTMANTEEIALSLTDHNYSSPPKVEVEVVVAMPAMDGESTKQEGNAEMEVKTETEHAGPGSAACQVLPAEAEKPEMVKQSENPILAEANTDTLKPLHVGGSQNSKAKRRHSQRKDSSCTKIPPKANTVCTKLEEVGAVSRTVGDVRTSFGCICGHQGVYKCGGVEVQCLGCGLWQHHDCVGYDLTDPYRGEYMCPHCHVAAVSIWHVCLQL